MRALKPKLWPRAVGKPLAAGGRPRMKAGSRNTIKETSEDYTRINSSRKTSSMKLEQLFKDAYTSKRALRKLNIALRWGIPFNKPHGLSIEELNPSSATVTAPYRRSNMNHLKGMHACCLATLAEYTSGLVMMGSVPSDEFRLIMKSLEMDYFFQAKKSCIARYSLSESVKDSEIMEALRNDGKVLFLSDVPVYDSDGNHICTGRITWQIKSWKQVKTQV
jgi:hypothetical protein